MEPEGSLPEQYAICSHPELDESNSESHLLFLKTWLRWTGHGAHVKEMRNVCEI
jgi:hypothetical protein